MKPSFKNSKPQKLRSQLSYTMKITYTNFITLVLYSVHTNNQTWPCISLWLLKSINRNPSVECLTLKCLNPWTIIKQTANGLL